MPHTQIVFIKLKMELFEDDRFLFDLNDRQKGLYLMLLGLAGKTNNMIRNELNFIKTRLNLKNLEISDLESISKTFPKFILHKGYWQFKNFEEHHNWYLGTPKGAPRFAQNKNKKENKNIEQDFLAPPYKTKSRKTVNTMGEEVMKQRARELAESKDVRS